MNDFSDLIINSNLSDKAKVELLKELSAGKSNASQADHLASILSLMLRSVVTPISFDGCNHSAVVTPSVPLPVGFPVFSIKELITNDSPSYQITATYPPVDDEAKKAPSDSGPPAP